MNATQYRKAIAGLGLSIVGAAPILGISRRQAQRLASGESPIPEAIAKLLAYMIRYGVE